MRGEDQKKASRRLTFPVRLPVFLIIFSLIIAAAGTLPGCAPPEDGPATEQNPHIGSPAPSFRLADLEGEAQALENYTGRPLIINFWTTWCRFCVAEMPLLQELYVSGEDVQVLAVNIKEQKEDVAAFIRDAGYTFPVLLDEEGEVAAAYRIRGLPTTFAVNADGVITAVRVGAFDAQGLAALVESAME